MKGQMMRILLLSAFPPPTGGIATWTVMYTKYCEKYNIPIMVVNTAAIGRRGIQINRRRNIVDEVKRTFRIISTFKIQIKEFKPDVVHLNTSCSQFGILRDYLCVKIACKTNIPIVLHCHCNVHEHVKGIFSNRIIKRITDKSDCVLVLNRKSEEYLGRFTKSDIFRVPNFIDEKLISERREVRSIIKEVLFVGHVQPMKGSVELLSAAAKLKDIHFILIGPLKENLDISQCPSNVTFLGQKDYSEIKKYYEKADVYLFPSHSEGFSMSLTEAMATGLPCIATDIGANKDMLEDKGGIIIPVGDVDAIVKALENLSDPTLRQKMSDWNIFKVRSQYSLEKVMGRINDIYQDILNKKEYSEKILGE